MKIKAFLDELRSKGVIIEHGKKHFKLYYGDKWTTCARHPSQELSNKSASNIRKQLGLE